MSPLAAKAADIQLIFSNFRNDTLDLDFREGILQLAYGLSQDIKYPNAAALRQITRYQFWRELTSDTIADQDTLEDFFDDFTDLYQCDNQKYFKRAHRALIKLISYKKLATADFEAPFRKLGLGAKRDEYELFLSLIQHYRATFDKSTGSHEVLEEILSSLKYKNKFNLDEPYNEDNTDLINQIEDIIDEDRNIVSRYLTLGKRCEKFVCSFPEPPQPPTEHFLSQVLEEILSPANASILEIRCDVLFGREDSPKKQFYS